MREAADILKNTSTLELPLIEEFFLDLINNNYSYRTLESYFRDLEIFECFLTDRKLSFSQLSKLEISRYKEFLRSGKYLKVLVANKREKVLEKTGSERELEKSRSDASRRSSMYSGRLSSRSVNRMLSAIRSYLSFLNDSDFKIPISSGAIKLIKTDKKYTQLADIDDLILLLEFPENYEKEKKIRFRNRAMLELLFSTGMRISELIGLNISDLRLSKKGDQIQDSRVFVMGKGKKQRYVYLTPRAKKYLQRYLAIRKDKYPALFIPYRGTRNSTKDPYIVRISTNYLQAKIKEYRSVLGINVPTSAHSFRHGFATYLAENGANPAAIQRLLGHESLQTTSRYVNTSDKFAETSHKSFHPLSE